jgi:hypothetical protein
MIIYIVLVFVPYAHHPDQIDKSRKKRRANKRRAGTSGWPVLSVAWLAAKIAAIVHIPRWQEWYEEN